MLVLTRKAQQSIRIGDAITVTVVHVRNSKVKLGFDYPRGITICRFDVTTDQRLKELEQETKLFRKGQISD